MKWLSPEGEALILCSRLELTNNQKKELEYYISSSTFNWGTFLDLISSHRITGLVFKHLKAYQEKVPRGIFWLLKRSADNISEGNNRIMDELIELYSHFNENRCRVILLKGARMLMDIYSNYETRYIGDIDLLIEETNAHKVHEILVSNGYGQYEYVDEEFIEMDCKLLDRYADHLQHYGEYSRPISNNLFPRFNIDLHFRLTTDYDSFAVDISSMINRSVQKEFNGHLVYTLNDSDHLIHLCIHLYSHTRAIKDIQSLGDLQLRRFIDIYEGIHALAIDWKQILDILQDNSGLRISVSYPLLLTEKIYGPCIPDDVRSFLLDDETILRHLDSISDRWSTDSDKVIGYWPISFEDRLINCDRAKYAYEVFYNYNFKKLESERGHKR